MQNCIVVTDDLIVIQSVGMWLRFFLIVVILEGCEFCQAGNFLFRKSMKEKKRSHWERTCLHCKIRQLFCCVLIRHYWINCFHHSASHWPPEYEINFNIPKTSDSYEKYIQQNLLGVNLHFSCQCKLMWDLGGFSHGGGGRINIWFCFLRTLVQLFVVIG